MSFALSLIAQFIASRHLADDNRCGLNLSSNPQQVAHSPTLFIEMFPAHLQIGFEFV